MSLRIGSDRDGYSRSSAADAVITLMIRDWEAIQYGWLLALAVAAEHGRTRFEGSAAAVLLVVQTEVLRGGVARFQQELPDLSRFEV